MKNRNDFLLFREEEELINVMKTPLKSKGHSTKASSKPDVHQVSIYVPISLHKKARLYCIENDITFSSLVTNLLIRLLSKPDKN